MRPSPASSVIQRRDFLRTAARLGGLATFASLAAACSQTEQPAPTTGRTATVRPGPSPSPVPTLTAVATASATAEATASATPGTSTTPVSTSTREPTRTPTAEPSATPTTSPDDGRARVAFVKTRDRAAGVQRALSLLDLGAIGGQVLLKPNFNSADPAPGSTHNDVLRALVQALQARGAGRITVADRSGMGNTRQVMQGKGIFDLAQELGFETLVFDEMEAPDWALVRSPEEHWQRGFLMARPCIEADALVQTCCLKTHRFGGHFTLSLKNSVGMVAKFDPGDGYNYMSELHSSPHQRTMIAEINAAYAPALVVMDGVEAFVTQGPDTGKKVSSEVILAGTDRVALDAVGVAILRHFGTTPQVEAGPIFEQEQIARAVELGLGVDSPEKIELVTGDAESQAYAAQIQEILMSG